MPASKNARVQRGSNSGSTNPTACVGGASRRYRISNWGSHSSKSTWASQIDRTRTGPATSASHLRPHEKPISRALLTTAQASSSISRCNVSSQSSPACGRPAGKSHRTLSVEISTISPASVTQKPQAPCGCPSGTGLGGCHDATHRSPRLQISISSRSLNIAAKH